MWFMDQSTFLETVAIVIAASTAMTSVFYGFLYLILLLLGIPQYFIYVATFVGLSAVVITIISLIRNRGHV